MDTARTQLLSTYRSLVVAEAAADAPLQQLQAEISGLESQRRELGVAAYAYYTLDAQRRNDDAQAPSVKRAFDWYRAKTGNWLNLAPTPVSNAALQAAKEKMETTEAALNQRERLAGELLLSAQVTHSAAQTQFTATAGPFLSALSHSGHPRETQRACEEAISATQAWQGVRAQFLSGKSNNSSTLQDAKARAHTAQASCDKALSPS